MVCATRPEHPVYCLRPHAVTAASRWFQNNFPGRVLFAVKTNPFFVETVAAAGIQHFDVASLAEIELISSKLPGARMSFMHPVKSRVAIRRAYFEFGIRDFSLDCEAELDKILEETGHAPDLNLFVRVAVSNRHSCLQLAGKFGISGGPAADLLLRSRQVSQRLGICFHAGSQIMRPDAYAEALEQVSSLIRKSGVIIDILDVGGGFPSVYPDLAPPPLADYVSCILECFEEMPVSETCELWCEPGRALVAEGASLVVKVEMRKDQTLYLNDGTYGGLFDAGQPRFIYPVERLERSRSVDEELLEFSFYGPTCDSMDFMPGPFLLPADIGEGDYIEIGNLGAYSMQLRTEFNGFNSYLLASVSDEPQLSHYGNARAAGTHLAASIVEARAQDTGHWPGESQ
ncbi:MAG: type III PLP-dependent enzyme [Gammaproteobacteria bacterium]